MEISQLGDSDIFLFNQGTNYRSYQLLGAHFVQEGQAVRFAVWAPAAKEVRLAGDFNGWNSQEHALHKIKSSGIWTITVPGIRNGAIYKYEIISPAGKLLERVDPYGFYAEMRPKNASIVFSLDQYGWGDGDWLAGRPKRSIYRAPLNIYEVHAGSWKRHPDGRFYNFRELADSLIDYVLEMGYTHIELLPIMEHPLDNSWGYQITGYFAATSRYGTPADLMYFVDCCHQKGIGVILDWVPGHFCRNEGGLGRFDGTHLYEPSQPQRRDNQGWGTYNFDFARPEVSSFLLSNAVFWLDVFHLDGLRIDAVANMIYLDFGHEPGTWVPNAEGGREHQEAVGFIKKLNEIVFANFPGALMIAEESSTWPMVTRPTNVGGLGFNYKWNMGWMNDSLKYIELDYGRRRDYHHLLTFAMMYAYSENFILALSHDEVVHGKKSLLDKMPGDYWQKFANLRAFFGFLTAHPGKKTVFMGAELGQFAEWDENKEIAWPLLVYPMHQMLQDYVRDLNHFYLAHQALWDWDQDQNGFRWIDPNNRQQSIYSFFRLAGDGRFLVTLINFSPQVFENFRLGVPKKGVYHEVFNSDWLQYGGSGQQNDLPLTAQNITWHNQPYSVTITVPPLACLFLEIGTGEGKIFLRGESL